MEFNIDIAQDFADKLGGRWRRIGPNSGEAFFEEILEPKFLQADKSNAKLNIYMDGTRGFGSSFLDQSFGELGRKYGVDKVASVLVFHTQLFNEYVHYIKENIWAKK